VAITPLTIILLALLSFFFFVVAVQRGGFIDSLRRLDNRGARALIVLVLIGIVGALAWRTMFYMNDEREEWIASGKSKADSVSMGFNTKSRFRSLAQPLGRVLDRNGKVLAGYELREGHLRRTYPAGPATAHLVGYWTGPLRDGVGIEKAMTLVNDSLKDDRPHDLKLTLDLKLQQDAVRALGGEFGAIVVMDPANGEVLAAADYPTYDPNRIMNDTIWNRLVRDIKTRPLISRVVRDNFSPGSSVKPWIAAAAASTGATLPEERGFSCSGTYSPGGRIKPIADHGSVHGAIDAFTAMRVSCNIYFSYLAYELVGFDALKSYFESIGYNKRLLWNTGAFLNESSTLQPAMSWIRARDEIAKTRAGIGQASVKNNAIHTAAIVSGIANGGIFIRPTLELGRAADTLPWKFTPQIADWMNRLMREPLLPGGTAVSAFAGIERRGITVYGKTGTADREPDGREPSWFISYAEKHGRRFVVIVAIQNRKGRFAGEVNAPMARKMFEALDSYGYFKPLPGAKVDRRRVAPSTTREMPALPSDTQPRAVPPESL
ncbi:MAG: hypothetical protein H7X80_04500, partial [bacterium]|nr:hypothetical protein [Candidatus Kapabacteria bacterium]